MLLQCKSCGTITSGFDDLSFGCPSCGSRFIDKYEGIIGMFERYYQQIKFASQQITERSLNNKNGT